MKSNIRARCSLSLSVGAMVLAAFACGKDGISAASIDAGMSGDGSILSSADRCARIARSIEEAGFGAAVKVSCAGNYANIVSDTVPEHALMNGITGTNDQVPVPAPGYTSPIALNPVRAAAPTSIDAALGVAVNGVPIYDYSSQGNNDLSVYDPKLDTKLTGELDVCNGHAGRGDDYHYHAAPTCMMSAMKNKGPSAILGWGFDGYPIYGDQNPDGSAIASGELDVCNAKSDATFGARYHTSATHPYVLQCLIGEVDLTKAPRVAPLSKQGGGGKPPGEKPQGGVSNLALVAAADGTRTMTYTHNGQNYSIQYKPGVTAGCFDFEETSFTTKGVLTKSTYCRSL
jgi:YHYH protein